MQLTAVHRLALVLVAAEEGFSDFPRLADRKRTPASSCQLDSTSFADYSD